MDTELIRQLMGEIKDLEAQLKAKTKELREGEWETFGKQYIETLPTEIDGGVIQLSIDYPYWHIDGGWHWNCKVVYKGQKVGQVGMAMNSYLEAYDRGMEKARELAANFNPNKRISGDDLDWWSR